ncbi:MAG: amino acid ABC transporter permease [Candidatus Tectomicrobia bacterium]|nr:amino acid ABC transporter permease [Candidatus Tectomicrobia bacterium]
MLTSLLLISPLSVAEGYQFKWEILYRTQGETHYGLWLLSGLKMTLVLACTSAFLAFILGTIFGIARLSRITLLNKLAAAYVEFFRNTPLLVQLFFWYFGFTSITPIWLNKFLYNHHYEFLAALIGLSIYTSAFMTEVIRAGIQAIPKGQMEAAFSTGLTRLQSLRYVILPQAFRIIIPPLGSQFLNNLKNSSLAMTIGVAELTWQSQQIQALTFRGFEPTTAATLIYLTLCLLIAAIINLIEWWLNIEVRKQ